MGLYACLMMGTIPIPCRPPMENSSFTAMLIAKESKAKYVLTSSTSAKVSHSNLGPLIIFPIQILRKYCQIQIIDVESIYGPRRSESMMEAYTQDYYDEDYYEELIPIDPFIPATLDETCYIDYSGTLSN